MHRTFAVRLFANTTYLLRKICRCRFILSTITPLFVIITGLLSYLPIISHASDTYKNSIQSIAIVADKNSSEIESFIKTLSRTLGNTYEVVSFYSSSPPALSLLDNKFIIAVGHRSLKWLIEKKVRSPILSTFISQTAFLSLIKDSSIKRGQVSAIYSDPDPDYQIRLIKKLYNRPVNVAVLLSHNTRYLRKELNQVARNNEVTIDILNVTASDNIYKVLNKISKSDVLLAVPDEKIYNLNTIRTILLTTYRHNQALIGFSQGMVTAGALASVTSNLEDVVDEIKNWIGKYKKYNVLPKARYARYFNVKINEHVAQSFKVENTSATALAKAVASEMITHLNTDQD